LRSEKNKTPLDLVTQHQNGLIHTFQFAGKAFLFDRSTHSLFALESMPSSTGMDDASLTEEISQLSKKGFFLASDPDSAPDNRVFKSFCLMMTRQCNFACTYCFEGQSSVSPQPYITPETALKAFRWIKKISPERKRIEADFFGGEPLLYFDQVKEIIEQSEALTKETKQEYIFSLTTNASLLTPDRLEFLNNHHISLIVSLDGEEAYQNKCRRFGNRQGTFSEVWPSIVQLMKTRDSGYYIRGTYTHQTLSFADQVKWMYEHGIQKISFEPAVSPNSDLGIQEQDLPRIKQEYEKLAAWYITQKQADPALSFYHFELDLPNGVCVEKLMTSCGAGVEYLSLAPDGSLYPCHQFDGNQAYCLGNIHEDSLDLEMVERFRHMTHLSNKTACATCWAKYLCGGGCLANNLMMNGSLETPFQIGCEIQKMRLEAALAVQGILSATVK